MEKLSKFRLLDAAFVIGSILTFIADQITDLILAITFFLDGFPHYCAIVLLLVIVPNAIVQIFSARWNRIDEYTSRRVEVIHGLLMGTLHRYYRVLTLGLEARRTGDLVDYQRYYQQWSDICMLRLFDSFMESSPQLVFQLYVLIEVSDWDTFNVTWTCISAIASTVSLGWGVAAYSQALRMVREDKSKMTWMGMVLQTLWRFSMLSARIVALVLISLTLHKWVFIVIGAHWMIMTGWVIWQNTDFCTNKWEERLYNAVVGIIYCFCFFNLKEGRSRYRMTCFYLVMFTENAGFVAAYYYMFHYRSGVPLTWFSFGAMIIVLGGTMVGLVSLLLYYRFFHPAGPISPCVKDMEVEDSEVTKSPDFTIKDATYVEEKETAGEQRKSDEKPEKKTGTLKHSRSFKYSTHQKAEIVRERVPTPSTMGVVVSSLDLGNSSNHSNSPDECKTSEKLDSAYGTDSNRTASRNTEASHTMAMVEKSPEGSYSGLHGQLNHSGSPLPAQDRSGSSLHNRSTSSAAFINETYMSIENASPVATNAAEQSYMSLTSPTTPVNQTTETNHNNTYQSVHPMSESVSPRSEQNTSQGSRITVIDTNSCSTPRRPPQDLLKRSPVLRDVTAGFTPIERDNKKQPTTPPPTDKGKDKLHAPLTIIIPNISNQAVTTKSSSTSPDKWSDKTIPLDILNPAVVSQPPADISAYSSHDYENLALVNINRAPLGVQHWRTYSDMANSRHDDSTKYERNKLNFTSSSDYSVYSNLAFCDIYPLSKEMKEQLYRSLTPVSTAATMASSLDTSDSNHTYEPIETAAAMMENVPPTAASTAVNSSSSSSAPLTLIHHDGRKVTANRIVSLDNLRETLMEHEKVPYDDPQSRGDLYILAPMRLLTPVTEESESDITRGSKLYQSLTSNHSQAYSDVDSSIMSIISEVLNIRSSDSKLSQAGSYQHLAADRHKLTTIEEDNFDTCSLLHTIEEIRNNSLCNLYYSSNTDLSQPPVPAVPAVPQVPPRNTAGYESLVKENQGSKSVNMPKDNQVGSTVKQPAEQVNLNDSIKSVHSNTLVVTPPTIKERKKKLRSPLSGKGGVRKNILNLVGSTQDILNTPKRVKISEKMELPRDTSVLSESVVSERNEFKSLVPHLSSQGAKFLSKVKASSATADSDLDDSRNRSAVFQGDFSTFSDTPSPKPFVRNIDKHPPATRRKFSILRQKFEPATTTALDDDNSDYKYGFMPENPDAKYGFGVFTNESYNVVETAKLCNSTTTALGTCRTAVINGTTSYSLSALNRGDTAFKLRPDEQYANFHRNWVSTSLQRRSSKNGVGDRTDTTRRSMSILDEYEEKENMGPRRSKEPPRRRPLAALNQTSQNFR